MRPCPGRSLRCFRRKCRSCPHRRNRPPSGGVLRRTPERWPAPNRHLCSSAVPRRPNRARGRQGVSGCGPAVRFGRPPVRRGGRPAPPYPFRPGRSPVLRPQSVFPGRCPLRLFRDGPYRLRGVCSGHGLRRLGTGVRIGYGRIPCSVGQYDCGLPYRCLFRDTGRSGEVKGRDQYPGQQCRRDGIPVRTAGCVAACGGLHRLRRASPLSAGSFPGRLFFVAAQGISYPFVEILICHLSVFSLSVPPRGMRRAVACRLSSAGPAAVRLARRRACMEPSAQYLYQFHPRPEVLRAGGRLAYSQHLRNFGIFVLLDRPQIEDGSVPFRQGVHARLYLSRRKFVEDRRRYGLRRCAALTSSAPSSGFLRRK